MQRCFQRRWCARLIVCALVCVLSAGAARADAFEAATDRPGLDYKTFELPAPLPAQCQKACNDDAQCQAWTFAWPGKRASRAHCSLKSGAPAKRKDNCCISGLRTAPVAGPVAPPAEPDSQITEPQPAAPPPAEQPVDLAAACDEYARQAVEANEENETLVCGLAGSRWGFGYDRYHAWCMQRSTARTRRANTEARAREIERCRASIGMPSYEQTQAQRLAEREQACQAYARRAARQAARARDDGCAVAGSRWLTAHQPHFSWCMTASKAERDSETRRRDDLLARCTAARSAGLRCEDFARVALDQAREAFERRCGFEGPRWRRNYGAHKAWCRTAGEDERMRETGIRARALNACRRDRRIAGACSRFAASAVSAAKRNVERGCGYQGTRWSLNAEEHFLWCMNARPHERRKERSARIAAMLKCTKQQQVGEPAAPQPRGFLYRWRAISPGAGDWSSQWIETGRKPACEHLVRGCQCGAANYCGSYRDGDVALWWPNGCIRRPWEILCEIRPR